MGGGADWTVIVVKLVWMMMEGDCRVGNEKKQNYSQRIRKFFMKEFICHRVNFKWRIKFVNSIFL